MGVESRYGLTFGYMEHGQRNLITDVPGVRVGQVTIHDGEVHTGVTAIIPHTGDVFHEKCLAGAHVINGFGKSIGLVQVQELGTLETPILLTNTLSVGTVSTALVEYMLERNDDIGLDAGTVNSLVMECNDARLSDIRGLHVTKEHAVRPWRQHRRPLPRVMWVPAPAWCATPSRAASVPPPGFAISMARPTPWAPW